MLFTGRRGGPEAEVDGAGVDGVVAAGPVVDQAAVSAVEVAQVAGAAAPRMVLESAYSYNYPSVDYPIVYIILNSKSMAYKIAKQRDDNL